MSLTEMIDNFWIATDLTRLEATIAVEQAIGDGYISEDMGDSDVLNACLTHYNGHNDRILKVWAA